MMKTGPKGIALIKSFEGFRADAYLDPVGVKTIGYGSTLGVELGQSITEAEASARLVRELAAYERAVSAACTVEPNPNEFDAMVSFCYNVGPANFRKSSVLRAHNNGDNQAAARAFALWNRAGNRVFRGLTRRRAAEAALYLEPEREFGRDAMPQQVDPERPMTASTINRASIAAGGTTALAATIEVAHQVNTVKSLTEDLGTWLVPGLLVLVLALLGYIVWERVNMRRQGWS
jgi:lysozyme